MKGKISKPTSQMGAKILSIGTRISGLEWFHVTQTFMLHLFVSNWNKLEWKIRNENQNKWFS